MKFKQIYVAAAPVEVGDLVSAVPDVAALRTIYHRKCEAADAALERSAIAWRNSRRTEEELAAAVKALEQAQITDSDERAEASRCTKEAKLEAQEAYKAWQSALKAAK